nr:23S rRNA (uracil(1939)-C(5))-methyltransferase RlmD [Helcococcus sueciensis]
MNIELEIIDLDDKGRGVAKKDGIIYFVENAILGETLLANIYKKKKSFYNAIKIETIKESPFLIEDIGEENLCGVYELYNIDYKKQIEYKKNTIINSINRIADEKLTDIDVIEAINKNGYRNKLELKVSETGKLAYFKRNSYDLIEINDCMMNTKEIQKLVKKLQIIITELNIPGYNPVDNTGVLKNIIIRSTSIGETMLIIVFNQEYNFEKFYKRIEDEKIVDSFYVSRNNTKNNYKIKDLIHISGKDKIKEILGEHQFLISPRAFMQVNKEVSYKIYLKAREYVEKINPNILVDLYSGISTTSIILSDLVEKVVSVEINTDAINDAKENALINGINNIDWINKPAEIAIDEISLNENKTMALFDPPRRGLDENIINKIGQSNISSIVYISCNVGTLARDIKRFKQFGFKLKEVTLFDQFVNTIETETVILLVRD